MSCCVCVCVCVCVVTELSAGGGWTSLIATVCLYTLLKFLQGGGAGVLSVCSHKRLKTKDHVRAHELHLSLFSCRHLWFHQQPPSVHVDQSSAVYQQRCSGTTQTSLLLTSSSSVCFPWLVVFPTLVACHSDPVFGLETLFFSVLHVFFSNSLLKQWWPHMHVTENEQWHQHMVQTDWVTLG